MEVLHILIVDFRQTTETRALEILGGPHPLTVVGESLAAVAARCRRSSARRQRESRVFFVAIAFATGEQSAAGCDRKKPTTMSITSGSFAS